MERLLKQERSIFMLDDYVFRSCPKTIYRKGGFIFEDSVIDLMNYLHREEGIIMCLSIKEYVKSKKPKKRAYSTSHRIEIAYKTRWSACYTQETKEIRLSSCTKTIQASVLVAYETHGKTNTLQECE